MTSLAAAFSSFSPAYAPRPRNHPRPSRRRSRLRPPPSTSTSGPTRPRESARASISATFDQRTGQSQHTRSRRRDPPAILPGPLALRATVTVRFYAVNAVADPSATVTTFDLDPKTGALTQKGKVTSAGAGPCYISVDSTGHAAFVANYVGGTIASYKIQPRRNPLRACRHPQLQGPEVRPRWPVPRPSGHAPIRTPSTSPPTIASSSSTISATTALSVFSIDPAHRPAHAGHSAAYDSTRPGSGPRHIAFHPNGRWIYSINELDSTIDHLLWTTTRSRRTRRASATQPARFAHQHQHPRQDHRRQLSRGKEHRRRAHDLARRELPLRLQPRRRHTRRLLHR